MTTISSVSSGTMWTPTTISASAFGTSLAAAHSAALKAWPCRKIVGGVVTQISPAGTGIGAASPITQAMIDARTAFQSESGCQWRDWRVPSLLSMAIQSLAGRMRALLTAVVRLVSHPGPSNRMWGRSPHFGERKLNQCQVNQGGDTVYSETFNARPIAWRAFSREEPKQSLRQYGGPVEGIHRQFWSQHVWALDPSRFQWLPQCDDRHPGGVDSWQYRFHRPSNRRR